MPRRIRGHSKLFFIFFNSFCFHAARNLEIFLIRFSSRFLGGVVMTIDDYCAIEFRADKPGAVFQFYLIKRVGVVFQLRLMALIVIVLMYNVKPLLGVGTNLKSTIAALLILFLNYECPFSQYLNWLYETIGICGLAIVCCRLLGFSWY